MSKKTTTGGGIREGGFGRRTLHFTYADIWFLVAAVVIGLVLQFIVSRLPSLYVILLVYVGQFWLNLIGILGIFVVGVGLYWFRENHRMYYGALEITFALAYGWFAINKVTAIGYVESISIIASVYLVVRGLDNYILGKEMRAKQAAIDKPVDIESHGTLAVN